MISPITMHPISGDPQMEAKIVKILHGWGVDPKRRGAIKKTERSGKSKKRR